MFAADAQWNSNATTMVDSSLLGYSPACLFVDKQNTWYAGNENRNRIRSGNEGLVNLTEWEYGVQCPFVSGTGDMYVYDYYTTGGIIRSINGTSRARVMIISTLCDEMFVDVIRSFFSHGSDVFLSFVSIAYIPRYNTR